MGGPIKLNEENQNLIKIIGDSIPHVICFGDFNDGPYQYNEYYDLKKMIREGKKLSGTPYSYS